MRYKCFICDKTFWSIFKVPAKIKLLALLGPDTSLYICDDCEKVVDKFNNDVQENYKK